MRPRRFILPVVALAASTTVANAPLQAQMAPQAEPLGTMTGEAEFFPVGERLEYGIVLGPVRLGKATMQVKEKVGIDGTPVYRTSLLVDIGAAILDFEVGLESWIEPSPFRSRVFERRQPGETDQVERYHFHPDGVTEVEIRDVVSGSVLSRRQIEGGPAEALDELAALFLLRTLSLPPGETLTLPRYFDPDTSDIEFTRLGTEKKRVPAGRYETLVYRAVMPALAAFQADRDPRVYVSRDADRLIVQLETDTPVGRLRMYLVNHVLNGTPKGADR